jgi:D-alanine--poly(phosphoribitol) ligase subunit 2
MEDRVINIIAEICENETIKDNLDIDLIENEILDSLAFITLISRLEEEFDIEIQPTQVKPDTWRSINSIIELVKSYNELRGNNGKN